MVYFDRQYEWRARFVDSDKEPLSQFSQPMDFQVLRGTATGGTQGQASTGDLPLDTVIVQDGESGKSVEVVTAQPQFIRKAVRRIRKNGVTNARGRSPASASDVEIPAPEPRDDTREAKALVLRQLFVDEPRENFEVNFND